MKIRSYGMVSDVFVVLMVCLDFHKWHYQVDALRVFND